MESRSLDLNNPGCRRCSSPPPPLAAVRRRRLPPFAAAAPRHPRRSLPLLLRAAARRRRRSLRGVLRLGPGRQTQPALARSKAADRGGTDKGGAHGSGFESWDKHRISGTS
eukprot:gene19906-biopygen14594